MSAPCDFFSKAIWTPFGKRQAFALMFIHIATRKVWVSPTTSHPDTAWVQQQGRNTLMWLQDQGIEATYLIHDRDTKFTQVFDRLLEADGIRIVKSPIRAANANAFAEAWIISSLIKDWLRLNLRGTLFLSSAQTRRK